MSLIFLKSTYCTLPVALQPELLKLTFGTQRDRKLSQIGNSKLLKIKLKATVSQE
jgi:hypothetical protein